MLKGSNRRIKMSPMCVFLESFVYKLIDFIARRKIGNGNNARFTNAHRYFMLNVIFTQFIHNRIDLSQFQAGYGQKQT